MAFTLAFHIVLASLGVALPAMILTANWLGLKRGDEDAMRLARRWSKAMAVTFAVGAVTGTVLSFEFGLLWPNFMARFGDAFGIAFAVEGIFFFTEAIFLAIYIYGWKRLSGWAHFWSGSADGDHRDRRRLLGRHRQLLDEPAAGLRPRRPAGKVVETEPLKVLFNPAWVYEVPHMILAAYMVVGFLVASIYAVGMLRGRRDRLHRLGLLIPLTIACVATPVQLFVGDTAAREVADHQPAKFAAMECVQKTGTHQTEYVGGICTSDGVKASIPIPDLDSLPGRLQRRHQGRSACRTSRPTNDRRRTRSCTSPSTGWSGSAPRCCCSASGSAGRGGGGVRSRARGGSCAPWPSPG